MENFIFCAVDSGDTSGMISSIEQYGQNKRPYLCKGEPYVGPRKVLRHILVVELYNFSLN